MKKIKKVLRVVLHFQTDLISLNDLQEFTFMSDKSHLMTEPTRFVSLSNPKSALVTFLPFLQLHLINESTHRNCNNQSTSFRFFPFAKAVRQSRQSGPLPQPRVIDEGDKNG